MSLISEYCRAVGYGNLVPRSVGSRTFCCFYSMVGIPLCLVALVNIGSQLDAAARWVETRVRRRLGSRRTSDADDSSSRTRCNYARSAIIALAGAVVFLLVPAGVFCCLQDNWDYGTSVYFAVISLSTIGFGDYVAGQLVLF